MEVVPVRSATLQTTIEKLRTIFGTHGLLGMLVSDNGSVFTSAEFKGFTLQNAICHVLVSPYHLSSNGLAERAVQSFKAALTKIPAGSIETSIAKFLFHQRLTPHTSTGNLPAELLMGRRPRSLLDVVRPDLSKSVRLHQESQKRQHDCHAKTRQFSIGDSVFVQNFSQQYPQPTRLFSEIVSVCTPMSYTVRSSYMYTVYANIIHTKRLLHDRTSSFSGLGRCTSYDWSATAKKQSPSMQDARVHQFLCLLFTHSRHGTYSQATPVLLNSCVLQCRTSLLADNCQYVEVQL